MIAEVYEKNEDIEYVKQKKKKQGYGEEDYDDDDFEEE